MIYTCDSVLYTRIKTPCQSKTLDLDIKKQGIGYRSKSKLVLVAGVGAYNTHKTCVALRVHICVGNSDSITLV